MFDELFELFDRDGRETRQGERKGGIRGFLSRLFAGDDDGDDDRDDGRPDDNRRRNRRDDDRRDRDEMFDFGD